MKAVGSLTVGVSEYVNLKFSITALLNFRMTAPDKLQWLWKPYSLVGLTSNFLVSLSA